MSENSDKKEIDAAATARVMDDVVSFYSGKDEVPAIVTQARGKIVAFTSADDLVSRLILATIQLFVDKLKRTPKEHFNFDTDLMKTRPQWEILMKDILMIRMQELKRARVVRRQKRVDISELRETFFGNKVLNSLGFGRRSIIKQTEYQELVSTLRKFNYTVPEIVDPTKTELFFSEEIEGKINE